jgi:hypothetical protein
MNDEEAQYRFRRTVAEVLKTITDPEEPAAVYSTEERSAAAQRRKEQVSDGD